MQPRNRLLLMSWAHLLNDGTANYLPGVLPVVLVSLGAPRTQAGVLMGVLLIGQGLQPAIGWFSDKVGGRTITLLGLYVNTLAGAMLGLVPNYWLMLLLLMLLGIANSCFHPQALAGVRKLASERRGLSMSVFLIGGELGRGLWPLLAGLVVGHLGLGYLWVFGLPAILCFPVLLMAFPTLPIRPPAAQPIVWRQHASPLLRVVVFTSLRATIVLSLITFLPLWWNEQGGGIVGGAALVTTIYVVGIFGNAAGGHLADHLSYRAVASLASFATVICMAATLLVTGPLLWLAISLLGITLFATIPLSIAVAQDALPENPSMGAGIGLGLCNAIGAVAVMCLGFFVNRLGITGLLWLVAIVIAPAAAIAAFALPQPHQTTDERVTDMQPADEPALTDI